MRPSKAAIWGIIAIVLIGAIGTFWIFKRPEPPLSKTQDIDLSSALEKTVDGDSMSPLIKNGEKILMIPGYYKDHVPENGDLVAYHYGGNNHYLIKQVRATDHDQVEIYWDSLKVNGMVMKNSAGVTYVFSENEMKMLRLYVSGWKIPAKSYLIFGDNTINSIDSRKFGAVSATDFLGKFIRP